MKAYVRGWGCQPKHHLLTHPPGGQNARTFHSRQMSQVVIVHWITNTQPRSALPALGISPLVLSISCVALPILTRNAIPTLCIRNAI